MHLTHVKMIKMMKVMIMMKMMKVMKVMKMMKSEMEKRVDTGDIFVPSFLAVLIFLAAYAQTNYKHCAVLDCAKSNWLKTLCCYHYAISTVLLALGFKHCAMNTVLLALFY